MEGSCCRCGLSYQMQVSRNAVPGKRNTPGTDRSCHGLERHTLGHMAGPAEDLVVLSDDEILFSLLVLKRKTYKQNTGNKKMYLLGQKGSSNPLSRDNGIGHSPSSSERRGVDSHNVWYT